jgi:hypothetical protein
MERKMTPAMQMPSMPMMMNGMMPMNMMNMPMMGGMGMGMPMMNPMMMNGMGMMGGMMPMPVMMCKMTCKMTANGMVCEMMPMDDASKDMFMECCKRMTSMMGAGMPMMMACGGMPMMIGMMG